jgi:hypothetical protein
MKTYHFAIILLLCLIACGSQPSSQESSSNKRGTNFDIMLQGNDLIKIINKERGFPFTNELILYNYAQEIEYNEGTLLIIWPFNKIYNGRTFEKYIETIGVDLSIWNNILTRFYWKNKGGNYEEPTAKKYFKINGETHEIVIGTTTPRTVSISSDTSVGIKQKGVTTFILTFMNKTIGLDIEILFIDNFENTDQLIKAFGLPDDIQKVEISWPEEKFIDGFFYKPRAGSPDVREHWRYKKYPDIVFTIMPVNGLVRGMSNFRNQTLYNQWNQ